MTAFAVNPEALKDTVTAALGGKALRAEVSLGELTVEVAAQDYREAARILHDAPGCRFEQLIDLCGVDYSTYGEGGWEGQRFCVVSHLLSVSLNQRLRLKVFAQDDSMPVVDSLTGIWRGADWYEREAFDLYGIMFEG
ncbi:MAG: NADH-quinone oxidoreductase subunit C, partial [Hylemonella sp.]|nr:NADH-quinone oxidoreductase subunit C [Hylemonella sp.]